MAGICVVSDFHGVVCPCKDAEGIYKDLGNNLALDNALEVLDGNIVEAPRALKVTLAGLATLGALSLYRRNGMALRSLYKVLNFILVGEDVDHIEDIVEAYVGGYAGRLDGRVLDPVKRGRKDGLVKGTGILSDGYQGEIEAALRMGGYPTLFQHIEARRMRTAGPLSGGLTNHIAGRKAEVLQSVFFDQWGFDPERTVYVGDDPKADGPILGVIPPEHFIYPSMDGGKDSEAAEFFAGRGATIARSEADYELALRSV